MVCSKTFFSFFFPSVYFTRFSSSTLRSPFNGKFRTFLHFFCFSLSLLIFTPRPHFIVGTGLLSYPLFFSSASFPFLRHRLRAVSPRILPPSQYVPVPSLWTFDVFSSYYWKSSSYPTPFRFPLSFSFPPWDPGSLVLVRNQLSVILTFPASPTL